jgi:hypothetical protein
MASRPCPICSTIAEFPEGNLGMGEVVHCPRCGEFVILFNADRNAGPSLAEPKTQALASHLIRKMAAPGKYVVLKTEFFEGLRSHTLLNCTPFRPDTGFSRRT